MITAGTAPPPGPAGELATLQNHVFLSALRTDPAKLTIPQAAVIYRAVTDILDASISQMILSRSHLGAVLRRFEAAMRRWRWDGESLANPIHWPITSEREVQDILWLILRSVFDDVVDRRPCPSSATAPTGPTSACRASAHSSRSSTRAVTPTSRRSRRR